MFIYFFIFLLLFAPSRDWYSKWYCSNLNRSPDSKVQGANMGPTWDLSAPDGPHVWPHEPCYQGLYTAASVCTPEYCLLCASQIYRHHVCALDGKLVFHSSNNLSSFAMCLCCVAPCESGMFENGLLWDTNDLILAIWTSDYITYNENSIHPYYGFNHSDATLNTNQFSTMSFCFEFSCVFKRLCSVCSYQMRSKISAL